MRVPREIADAIIQHAEDDPTFLCNLCLVSSSFLPNAQRVLYREIRIADPIHGVYSVWFINMEQFLRFLKTIVEHNNALAKHVQKLHLPAICRELGFLALANQGLQLMHNLKVLTGGIAAKYLPKNISFQLNAITHCETWSSNPSLSPGVAEFLASQTSLKSLYICGDPYPNEPFPKTYFPNLEALGGNRRIIEKILPDRPLVTKLSWLSRPPREDDIITPPHTVASRLANIRILSLGGHFPRPDLRLFLPYSQSLQVLHIYGESPQLALHNEFAVIPSFPMLQVLIWTAGLGGSFEWRGFETRMNKNAQYILVKTLFSKTTILEKIYVQISKAKTGISLPKVDLQYYLCWERDGIETNVVDSRDAVAAHGVMTWFSL